MTPEIVRRHSAPVPRYTSYPTANHFSPVVQAAQYADWLSALAPRSSLGLYVHVPFCRSICWYCACTTKAAQRYEPVAAYLDVLCMELANVARRVSRPHRVTDIHWGGGSPDIIAPADIRRLGTQIRERFEVAPDVDFAVEIDPRLLTVEQADAFAAVGVTRVSIGVQDFDPAVQKAIGREQSYETTRKAVELFRERGVRSVNIDLVYGLPYQTRRGVQRTIEQVMTLAPDRVAIFGYAHLPERMTHQRLVDATALPDVVERFGQASRVARMLEGAGYKRIGLDHFARPGDAMADGPVYRNFQGYTPHRPDALLGIGASAIGELPQGFAQNTVPIHDYERRIRETGFATARGMVLSEDDRIRGYVIDRLMCDLRFSSSALRRRFGAAAEPLIEEAGELLEADRDGFVEADDDGFRLTPRGRTFVRTVCAGFDAWLGSKNTRHSLAV